MSKKLVIIAFLFFLASCYSSHQFDAVDNVAQPQLVVVEGTAAYNPQESAETTRRLALADAERQAAQQSAVIQSNTSISRDQVHTTTQIHPQNNIGQARIIAQQQNPGTVSLLAEIEAIPRNSCDQNIYKKKIAVTTFSLFHSEHAPDLPRINYEFAEILARKLHESQNFIIRDIEDLKIFENYPSAPYPLAPRIDEYQDNPGLIFLAEKVDAQFIVSGVIQDFNFRKMDSLSLLKILPYNIFADERALRVEIFIYDGLTGAMIYRKKYDKNVKGKVYFPNVTHLDTAEVSQSDLGKLVAEVILTQVRDIDEKLRCFPLMEKILRVDGEKIYFNAGSLQNFQVGDTLLVYSAADKYSTGVYYQDSRLRGYTEKAKAILTVQQVQPLFSMGVLDIKNNGQVYPLDIIRSW